MKVLNRPAMTAERRDAPASRLSDAYRAGTRFFLSEKPGEEAQRAGARFWASPILVSLAAIAVLHLFRSWVEHPLSLASVVIVSLAAWRGATAGLVSCAVLANYLLAASPLFSGHPHHASRADCVLWLLVIGPASAVLVGRLRSRSDDQLRRLAEAQSRLHALLAACPDAIVVSRPDGALVYANERGWVLLGWGNGRGAPLHERIAPSGVAAYHALCKARLAAPDGGEPARMDVEIDGPSGPRQLELRLTRFPLDETVFLLHVLRDVTDQRRSQAAASHLAAIVESSTDAVTALSSDGRFTAFNRAAETLFGFRADEVLGKPIDIVLPAARGGETQAKLRRLLRGEALPPFETQTLRKDGRPIDVAVSLFPIRGPADSIAGVSAIVRDASAPKRLERLRQFERAATLALLSASTLAEACRRTVEHLAETLEWPAVNVWVLDPRSGPRLEASSGPPGASPANERASAAALAACRDGAFARTGGSSAVFPIAGSGAVLGVLELAPAPDRVVDPDLAHALTNVCRQLGLLAERLKAAGALAASEERFRSLVSHIPGIVYRLNLGRPGGCEYLSEQVSALTGYPAEDFAAGSRAWSSFILEEDLAGRERGMARAAALGEPYSLEYRIVRADGSVGWVLDRGRAVTPAGKPPAAGSGAARVEGVVLDITDHKRAQELLLRSRDFYLGLLDGFPGLVWRAGPNGGRDYFSRAWLEFTGRPLEALLGERWLEDVHADDRERCAKGYRAAVEERRPFTLEYRLRRQDGEYRQLLERCSPVQDLQGAFAGLIGACYDVTEAKRAQDADDLARREAMQREFVANVSHELRTPVAAIRGFAETLVRGALRKPAVAAEFVETIGRHAERLQRLIEDLLEISVLESGRRPARPEAVELAPFVWSLCKSLAPIAQKRRVTLRVAIEPGLSLWVDRDHLGQVLQNLCDNAIKFNKRGGGVTIEGRARNGDAQVSVRDTGNGIPAELLPCLFERFHRKSRPSEKGVPSTGLGLSIVKGLVELNAGSIAAESTARGATFILRFPVAQPLHALPPRLPDPRVEPLHQA
ncbi:MAG: PAS domain S-box protein [Elusimicrobia bacterium]|nr:PAS domain S-box protein [Elusimicrobiota bacterium]